MSTDYVAVIGDAVASRALPAGRRARLQEELTARLVEVNRRWADGIAARFTITLGDEFQGLLAAAAPAWEIAHWLRAELDGVDWILAVGRGPVATPLAGTARQVDGPCFHRARSALADAKRERRLLAFAGFEDDAALNALAGYYSALYWGWTERQRRAASLLRVSEPAEVARRLGVGRSAVSHLASRMSWRLVAGADQLFRARLTEG